MATNFGTKIAINWLCVNNSDSAIDYVGGVEWLAYYYYYYYILQKTSHV